MMPEQKPHRSKQDYCTPPEFLDALKWKLGIDYFMLDLAATAENTVAFLFYDETRDSLKQDWKSDGWGFCNPPYANIRPWVQKAWFESQLGAKVAMLVPASTGSNWWRDWVDGKACVLFMNGRLSFDGIAPYPKDTAILLYDRTYVGGYGVWNWRKEVA
jgi:phage N-6-adenine-methyltransferase